MAKEKITACIKRGRWLRLWVEQGAKAGTFTVSIPNQGVPDFRIVAKNADEAKETLGSYLYNELDGKEDIVV